MELKTRDELRHATAGLSSGNREAIDRLVWTGVFGPPDLRQAARAAGGVTQVGRAEHPGPHQAVERLPVAAREPGRGVAEFVA